jgi:hypothetical protein
MASCSLSELGADRDLLVPMRKARSFEKDYNWSWVSLKAREAGLIRRYAVLRSETASEWIAFIS